MHYSKIRKTSRYTFTITYTNLAMVTCRYGVIIDMLINPIGEDSVFAVMNYFSMQEHLIPLNADKIATMIAKTNLDITVRLKSVTLILISDCDLCFIARFW